MQSHQEAQRRRGGPGAGFPPCSPSYATLNRTLLSSAPPCAGRPRLAPPRLLYSVCPTCCQPCTLCKLQLSTTAYFLLQALQSPLLHTRQHHSLGHCIVFTTGPQVATNATQLSLEHIAGQQRGQEESEQEGEASLRCHRGTSRRALGGARGHMWGAGVWGTGVCGV